jgi:hypothetical protein
MGDYKKQIARIEAQNRVAGPRTLAEVIRWTTARQNANGGTLSPVDRLISNFYFRRLYEEAEALEHASRPPEFSESPARQR